MGLTYRELLDFNASELAQRVGFIPTLQVDANAPGAQLLIAAKTRLIEQIEQEFHIPDPDTFWPTEVALREIDQGIHGVLDTSRLRATYDIPFAWQAFVDLQGWITEHAANHDGAPEDLGTYVCHEIARELILELIDELISGVQDYIENQTADPYMQR